MKTPVIIAAYNEADRIGTTLESIDKSVCEPYVVVNGSEGAQETAAVARAHTDHVYISEEQGQFPAIQFALRRLIANDPDAFGHPILITDADTKIRDGAEWEQALSHAIEGPTPKSVGGLVLSKDCPPFEAALRNTNRFLRTKRIAAQPYNLNALGGPSIGLNFANNSEIIEEIMDAPHIWLGNDRYMAHVVAGGDEARFIQLTSIGSAVMASERYSNSLLEWFLPRQKRVELTKERYLSRQAIGATHMFDTDSLQLLAVDKQVI
ncbi:MAG: glycosyltransferase family A protein [Patescibacteria group bacterium]